MAKGIHLYPSRTQKLSLSALMVLVWKRIGRVGRRQIDKVKLALRLALTKYSWVAQWWSNRLLTERLWVRVPPWEPYAGVAEQADAQDLKSCEG